MPPGAWAARFLGNRSMLRRHQDQVPPHRTSRRTRAVGVWCLGDSWASASPCCSGWRSWRSWSGSRPTSWSRRHGGCPCYGNGIAGAIDSGFSCVRRQRSQVLFCEAGVRLPKLAWSADTRLRCPTCRRWVHPVETGDWALPQATLLPQRPHRDDHGCYRFSVLPAKRSILLVGPETTSKSPGWIKVVAVACSNSSFVRLMPTTVTP
ncbi:hypothetical protein CO2235_MP40077 [Cupriavidus oxalaticus]|uniref:Uncharacterized protein n=1 Tax=Cupriavidus oxalaticus TaxID=96344 RepID=A0A375GFG8_9BURK|nr:hypothetical protein CO2235_MP40077 [Cupriavidus oxalaticus]